MQKISSTLRPLLYMVFMIYCFSGFSMDKDAHAVTLDKLHAVLPKQVMNWTVEAEDRVYNTETIFGYIDGGAEVYRAYNMRRCLSRRYTSVAGPAIVLDIFDMGSSGDAYGVFTHDPAGDVIDLGQDGRLRPGWLNFWKDRFFISIYTEEETVLAIRAVKALGEMVDSLISTRGTRPEILELLPPEGLIPDSIRYLHHPIILNYHYYISDENLLHLSPETDAVLAGYKRQEEQALILMIFYPEPDGAVKAQTSFLKNYLPDADKNGMAILENNKWCAARVKDRLLTIVLEADSRHFADKLLEAVK